MKKLSDYLLIKVFYVISILFIVTFIFYKIQIHILPNSLFEISIFVYTLYCETIIVFLFLRKKQLNWFKFLSFYFVLTCSTFFCFFALNSEHILSSTNNAFIITLYDSIVIIIEGFGIYFLSKMKFNRNNNSKMASLKYSLFTSFIANLSSTLLSLLIFYLLLL